MQEILLGDCLEVMKTFPDNHFTSIITDPPYGLHFMGKGWDYGIPNKEYWKEALRICKPGAMLLSFGGTRTYHRLACEIEDAEWEIRDCVMWVYGSGFPKSHNFGKQMSDEWKGYGTALKPAYEPIIFCMKPLDGTFAQNAEKWGVAGLNIDACRIEGSWKEVPPNNGGRSCGILGNPSQHPGGKCHDKGRWPANLILSPEAGEELDRQSGFSTSRAHKNKTKGPSGWKNSSENEAYSNHNDYGGASRFFKVVKNEEEFKNMESSSEKLDETEKEIKRSRFFYCAKSSSSERNKGLEKKDPLKNDGSNLKGQNTHPTVKPIALMEYLIKLIMPPKDGLILDPFAGSGTTIIAAKKLGFSALGIEKEPEYAEIAKKRLEAYESVPEQLSFL